jgi:hypothetical protein
VTVIKKYEAVCNSQGAASMERRIVMIMIKDLQESFKAVQRK